MFLLFSLFLSCQHMPKQAEVQASTGSTCLSALIDATAKNKCVGAMDESHLFATIQCEKDGYVLISTALYQHSLSTETPLLPPDFCQDEVYSIWSLNN